MSFSRVLLTARSGSSTVQLSGAKPVVAYRQVGEATGVREDSLGDIIKRNKVG